KVDSVLNLMTLEEKVGQMTLFTSDLATTGPTIRDDYVKLIKEGKVGALFNAYGTEYTTKLQKMATEETRLGIPLLFGYDVIHGFRTIFPIPLGIASSWNTELAELSARVSARESAASGLHWTYAPMVDIARDARWGRIAESAGEDPYLSSRFGEAYVKGYQGDDLSDTETILATVKHFAAYGAAIAGRDYNTVNMSERKMREIYLPPFKAGLDAGAATVMTAFNEYNGVPATANEFLFNQILRQEWGFEGFVVTDYTSIPEMIAHGFTANETEAAYEALQANVDMDMQSGLFLSKLPELVESGRVDSKQINQAVRRILATKFKLGLFEDPFRYIDAKREKEELLSKENRMAALKTAQESIVLLKNENALLPLDKKVKKLAVIGPLADSKKDMLGSWSAAGHWEDNVTILKGIKDKVSENTEVTYAKGVDVLGKNTAGISEAVEIAQKADVAILVLGEKRLMSGEAASRATLDLPGKQQQLLEAVHETGTPVVLVLANGRPLAIEWADKNIPAIVETWYLGTEAGNAAADVLFGDVNPSGKLPVTFPRTAGMEPLYYNHKSTGRPKSDQKYTSKYIDVENSPLYPFGYGLSYTTFNYSGLDISSDTIRKGESVEVSVTVKNEGDVMGKEIVQLYIHDLFSSITRPVKELRRFEKIALSPGEEQQVTFTLNRDDFSFYNSEMEKVVEAGEFNIMVGSSSADTDLQKVSLMIRE
ncbi:MAG TPA: glycoside hydrolase family 3 N-terminal domain-containing protein, partial [Fodinibius sp.]|nr:glycoside hydrolase family 3 N-terminal domain-containing protein [Fodinibius sp.]